MLAGRGRSVRGCARSAGGAGRYARFAGAPRRRRRSHRGRDPACAAGGAGAACARGSNANSRRSPRCSKASAPPRRCGRCMPNNAATATAKACAGCCSRSCATCAWCSILLSRHLARLRLAAHAARAATPRARAAHARHPCAARQSPRHLAVEVGTGRPRVPLPRAGRPTSTSRACSTTSAAAASASSRQVKHALREALAAQGIRGEVAGRPKHIYSIWKKMQKKNVPIGELYDLRALRVLVDDVPACYAVLGVVHALWLPVPDEFDDYIARPKRNDYRSLHTAVIGPEGKTLEVQIRTHEMHAQAELGVAAHWKYKEGRGQARARTRRWKSASRGCASCWKARRGDEAGLLRELDSELVEDRIYVLTPRGEVIDLPQGATPLDFAYRVHTEVGHRCRGAKVDGRIVPLDHVLRSGDRVEILTGKVAEPRRDWLVAVQRLPGQRAFARKGAQLVPQARPRAQPAGRPRTAGPRTQAPRPGARPTSRRCWRASTCSTDDDLRRARRAGRRRPAPGRPRAARTRTRAGRTRARAESSPVVSRAPAQQGALGLHHRRRRQPARATRALLPAAAGRTHRRVPHARQGHLGASRRLRDVRAPGRGATAARDSRRMGRRGRRARSRRRCCSRSIASGC